MKIERFLQIRKDFFYFWIFLFGGCLIATLKFLYRECHVSEKPTSQSARTQIRQKFQPTSGAYTDDESSYEQPFETLHCPSNFITHSPPVDFNFNCTPYMFLDKGCFLTFEGIFFAIVTESIKVALKFAERFSKLLQNVQGFSWIFCRAQIFLEDRNRRSRKVC